MNRSFFNNISGIGYDPVNYRGLPGKVRYFALVYSAVILSIYMVLTAGVLPLFIRGYESLGSDKSRFWMMNYEFCGKLLIATPLFIFFSFILGVIAYYDSEEEKASLLESGYIISANSSETSVSVYIWTMLFLLAAAISFFLSGHKDIAISGEEGWYCGMQQYMAVGVTILLIPLFKLKHTFFVIVAMLASFAVNITGLIMDIFGNVFSLRGWTEGKVSTVGNANWYCGYIVTVFFLGVALYYSRGEGKQIRDRINTVFLTVFIAVGAYMYVAQGSASGFVALFAVFLLLLIISGRDLNKLLRVSEIFVIFASGLSVCSVVAVITDHIRANDAVSSLFAGIPFSVCTVLLSVLWMISIRIRIKKGSGRALLPVGKVLGIVTSVSLIIYFILLIINTAAGGRLFGYGVLFFGQDWGSSRGMTISVGARLFKGMTVSEKIFGTGPDTFYSLLTSGRYPALAAECKKYFSGARLTNAHCEPVTMLVNLGIFGATCFYGMLFSVLVKTVRAALCGGNGSGCSAERRAGDENASEGGDSAAESADEHAGDRGFILGVSLCIVAYIVNNLFSFQTVMNLSQISLILGFGASAVMNGKSEV